MEERCKYLLQCGWCDKFDKMCDENKPPSKVERPLTNEEIMMRALHEEPVYVQCLHPPQEGEMPSEWWDVLTTSGLGTHVGFMVLDDVPIDLSKNGVEYFMWANEPTPEEREIAAQK